MSSYNVTPHIKNVGRFWRVELAGAKLPIRIFLEKSDAINFAKEKAGQDDTAQVIIHDTHGRIIGEWEKA